MMKYKTYRIPLIPEIDFISAYEDEKKDQFPSPKTIEVSADVFRHWLVRKRIQLHEGGPLRGKR